MNIKRNYSSLDHLPSDGCSLMLANLKYVMLLERSEVYL